MSHFAVHVLIPRLSDPSAAHVEAQVERLLAPYSENLEVEPYEEPCYCVGRVARTAARDEATAKVGTLDELRARFKAKYPELDAIDPFGADEDGIEKSQEVWSGEFVAPLRKFEQEAFEAHPLAKVADAACEECKGSGIVESTANPKGEWDWWCIGGRWTGGLTDADPAADPENFESCFICRGTGTRTDMKVTNGCNNCHGKGIVLKFPSKLKNVGNAALLSEFLPRFDKKHCPFALITPDGAWHERGDMGWFGVASGEEKRDVWVEKVRALYAAFPESVVVLVDCHV